MTMRTMLPLICEPDLDVELVTITPMYAGRADRPAAWALLPGSVDQPLAVRFRAKPLNALGEAPPPGANAYTSTCVVAEAVLPPSSVIVVVTVYGPVAV